METIENQWTGISPCLHTHTHTSSCFSTNLKATCHIFVSSKIKCISCDISSFFLHLYMVLSLLFCHSCTFFHITSKPTIYVSWYSFYFISKFNNLYYAVRNDNLFYYYFYFVSVYSTKNFRENWKVATVVQKSLQATKIYYLFYHKIHLNSPRKCSKNSSSPISPHVRVKIYRYNIKSSIMM